MSKSYKKHPAVRDMDSKHLKYVNRHRRRVLNNAFKEQDQHYKDGMTMYACRWINISKRK